MKKLIAALAVMMSIVLLFGSPTWADSRIYLPLVFRPARPTSTPSPTPSDTPAPPARPTDEPTATQTPSPTPSTTATATSTPTPTNSLTATATATTTQTPTRTATPTSTATHTPTRTPDPTATPTWPITINDVIDYLDGRGRIYSGENPPVYLGFISSSCYWSESIVYRYGDYGSRYSSTSISNPYGPYGSPYSPQSAFNRYASYPPAILTWDGYQWLFWAYVTNNPYKYPRIDSAYLLAYLRWKGACP